MGANADLGGSQVRGEQFPALAQRIAGEGEIAHHHEGAGTAHAGGGGKVAAESDVRARGPEAAGDGDGVRGPGNRAALAHGKLRGFTAGRVQQSHCCVGPRSGYGAEAAIESGEQAAAAGVVGVLTEQLNPAGYKTGTL